MKKSIIHDFICNQNAECKVHLSGQSRMDFMREVSEFQQQNIEDVLADSECKEAIEAITRILFSSF